MYTSVQLKEAFIVITLVDIIFFHNMALLAIPNELLLIIAENLIKRPKHVSSLLLSNRRLASLLTPLLHSLAVQDKDGWAALQWAAQRGHEALAELVLSKGADVNAKDNFFGQSAFYLAVKNRRVGFIGILLSNGADTNSDRESRQTALNWAARDGRADVVELLLKGGADVDLKDGVLVYGATPLHLAASNGHEAVVRLLLDNGADIFVNASYGGSALDWAKQGGHEDMCRLLSGYIIESIARV